jgi:hypothetical protein
MKGTTFGALLAGAMLALGGTALADNHEADAKGCYRKSCGSSVKGHSGSCAGTRVEAVKDEKTCSDAGGAWLTAADAAKIKM